jgi:hypothetical protein
MGKVAAFLKSGSWAVTDCKQQAGNHFQGSGSGTNENNMAWQEAASNIFFFFSPSSLLQYTRRSEDQIFFFSLSLLILTGIGM